MKAVALALLAVLAATAARAEDSPQAPAAGHMGHQGMSAPPPLCQEPKPQCAQTAEPFFARDGRLWLAFSVGSKVYVASSRDNGQTFAPAVTAAEVAGQIIDANGEARPKVVVFPDGALMVSFTSRPEKSYNGAISIVRSTDGGKSFSPPQPLLDAIGQHPARVGRLAQAYARGGLGLVGKRAGSVHGRKVSRIIGDTLRQRTAG